MAFEVFKKTSAPLARVPTVTIQKRGLMSLNRAAHALIGSPEHVELLYDADRRMVGLRPTEASNPNAYPARPQNSSKETGPILVAGTMFTRYYDIPTDVSRRWTGVRVEDGVLVVPLDEPSQAVTSNRSAATRGGGD